MEKKQSPFYNRSQLKERGWTDTAIDRFMKSPDLLSKNRRRRGAKIKLYDKDRAHTAESSPAWKAWKQKSQKRSDAMKASAAKKRNETLSEVNTVLDTLHLSNDVTGLDYATLKSKASENFLRIENNRAQRRKNYTPEKITSRRTDKFFHRIITNWLRHDGTTYDSRLDELFNKIGVNDGKVMIRTRIYDLIAQEYPYLADECERQNEVRTTKLQRQGKI